MNIAIFKLQRASKLFNVSCFFLLFHYTVAADFKPVEKLVFPYSDVDIELLKTQYCAEGFLQGTLVETMKGSVPIEQIEVGDYLLGIEGVQEAISVKKGKVDRYVRLLMSNGEYIHAAMHQNFYLADETWWPAAGLCPGRRLFNELYVVDNEFIHEPCNSYCLTTEHHAFFIYPEIRVHNFNSVIIGSLGSFIIGSVEVSNPIAMMLGIIVPLSVYATQYFRSKIVYNYEFSDADSKLTVEELCLQNSEVVQQARNYYDTKRRALNDLYQALIKVKNDVGACIRPNGNYTFDFSFGFLSQYKPASYNLSGMISLASEMKLSLANKEKLLQMRQAELDTLQQDIFDTHLILVLHITELIDQRDLAKLQLDDIAQQIYEEVCVWNANIDNIPIDIALAHYTTLFNWLEMFDNLEFKIKELKCVMNYYEKLKSHFFMTRTTNFIDIFYKQININQANLEHIANSRDAWWSNIKITEDFLRERNLLTHKCVDECKLAGKQYRAEKDKNSVLFAQKKKNDIKKQINKEFEEKKKGGGGGPEDPDDPDNKPSAIVGYFKNVFTHAFTGEKGHLIDTPTNRILILKMASNIKNFIIKDVHGNYWYAEILKDGRQLWAWAREGFIRDCGINDIARTVTKYGLCRDNVIK